jgi:predicted nuclease of predicted toxin-antitoxin system
MTSVPVWPSRRNGNGDCSDQSREGALDQNLSFRLVDVLLPRFPGSCHVRDVGLAGEDDERIWALAKTEGFIVVTEDNDFLARDLVRGHSPQVVQVCPGNASTLQVANLLRARLEDIEQFVTENTDSVFLLRE